MHKDTASRPETLPEGNGRVFAGNYRAYLDKGWLPVPVCCARRHCKRWPDCGGKHPLPRGYHGPQTEATYRRWAKIWPDADIGIVMGPDQIGIDVDHYGAKTGLDTFRAIEDETGTRFPAAPVTTSKAKGSGIRLFRLSEEWVNGSWPASLDAFRALSGIDIITAGHRFAMVWPSKHPETGNGYKWAYGDIPDAGSLEFLPDEIAEFISGFAGLRAGHESVSIPAGEIPEWLETYADPDGEPCGMTELILETWIKKLREGSTHPTAYAGTQFLLEALADGHRGVYAALAKLRAEFLRLRAERGGKEVPEEEWRRFLESLPVLDPNREYPALNEDGECEDCADIDSLRNLYPVGRRLREVTPSGSGLVRWGNEIEEKLTEWLWIKYVALGAASIIDGEKGVGKTSIVLDIGARVTSGADMPDGSYALNEPENILVLSPENLLEETLLPKLRASGADMGRVAFPPKIRLVRNKAPEMYQLPGAAWKIADMIRAADARLVIIEPITAFLEPGVNSHNEAAVRSALAPLLSMLPDLRCALVITRNMTKNTSTEARYRGSGSAGFSAVARVAMVAGRIPEGANEKAKYGLSQVDVNMTKLVDGTLSYDIVDSDIPADEHGNMIGVLKWHGSVDLDADALTQRPDKKRGPEATAQEEIKEVFERIFSEKDTWDSKQATAVLRAENVSTNRQTIKKVMDAMGIRVVYRHKEGGGFAGVDWTIRKRSVRQQGPRHA